MTYFLQSGVSLPSTIGRRLRPMVVFGSAGSPA